jgi:16S rRNA (adenine1518-N6/adenine1519-N6)-dimethyltransferase
VQAGFRQRRKQLHNALGRELGADREGLAAAFAACGVMPEQRAQTLTLEQWACLLTQLGPVLGAAA